ncbi:type VI secretion system contractile sheath small subunit [Sansalvadorimonas sp. 2012CJ34-2]|uniref:Type VI secretion system contractile sheath small subunit n=1 Tax=Parendozoicomonas callyspongiae TaxID=2942213 RepID=A0ABT0PBT0_9GAMM|nr:type VI secretion system contractile sheath small subunit [Sansalvadorimonas sp. 2012CJ34-2]MCL6268835.1 type VI secretion system contractile sheath small subunit [Sansalvadorimonas sp. 2012CJ34-2]
MALDSQHKRIRKNRVSITYDVETLGSSEKKELPFVVGVIGNYSGECPDDAKVPIEEREFINVTKDNFNKVMKRIGPQLNIEVENTLSKEEDADALVCSLKFESIKDFSPPHLITQIPELNQLVSIRNQLLVLLGKADRSRALEKELKDLLQSNDNVQSLATELGVESG